MTKIQKSKLYVVQGRIIRKDFKGKWQTQTEPKPPHETRKELSNMRVWWENYWQFKMVEHKGETDVDNKET